MARTFTRIGKQIAIAVKAGGPDPENNPHLRAVVATAKRENMPKDNVERAIKNAMGKDQKDYKEMNYEGYGPFGIAVFVETATDNTTRTVANVRSVFNKFGGTLGTSGSLDFMFSWKSMFTITKKEGVDMDDLILELIDYGVEEEYDEDEDYDDDEDGLSFIEMECPNCSEVVEIDEELLFDDSVDVICPNCHAVILSSEDDCDDCDDSCGCGCGCEVESEDEEK